MENKLKLSKYLADQVMEQDLINLQECCYEDVFLRILVMFEEKQDGGGFSIEEKMKRLAEKADEEDANCVEDDHAN